MSPWLYAIVAIAAVSLFIAVVDRIARRSGTWTVRSSASLYLILLPPALAIRIEYAAWLMLLFAAVGVLFIALDVRKGAVQ